MLKPKNFELDGYEFIYTPLTLRPARKLYLESINRYGSIIASFIAAFEAPKKFSLDSELDILINAVMKSIGHGIRDFSLSVDADWLESVMIKILLPNLQVKIEGNFIPVNKDWYELEMGTRCSTEIGILIHCFKFQYSDFLARWETLSDTVKSIRKNVRGLTSLKNSIGKSGV